MSDQQERLMPPEFKRNLFLQPWIICLLFALWFLFLPAIIGIVLLIFYYKTETKFKKKYESYINSLDEGPDLVPKDTVDTAEIDQKQLIEETSNYICEELSDFAHAQNEHEEKLQALEDEYQQAVKEQALRLRRLKEKRLLEESNLEKGYLDNIATLKSELKDLKNQIFDANVELRSLNDEIVSSHYSFSDIESISSPEYKNKLALLKLEEQELLKSGNAVSIHTPSTRKSINANIKQIIRCFNAECNNIFIQLTPSNIDSSRNKVFRSFTSLNTIYEVDGVALKQRMLELKLEELLLHYAYKSTIM